MKIKKPNSLNCFQKKIILKLKNKEKKNINSKVGDRSLLGMFLLKIIIQMNV
jgi:hypothetical protein